ncbi:hypothetical protein [Bartonella tribocorum]|uniref:Uncharacterized protein n=1 Tax=Bartonella tribocorum TaxID=85701 RepID=A0A2M6UTG6_9HYPH|nr:hypothetical protein [Bartonella tribocorum]PIT69499.1 hypothetical protein CEV08_06060 [Bartonella tribocorum]
MMKIFKNYVLSVFISSTFFISQTVNVNANYLINEAQKEKISVSLMKQVKNAKSDVVFTTFSYVPSISYQTENEITGEGKFEKVIEPMSIGMGLFFTGCALRCMALLVNLIESVVSISKKISEYKTQGQ